MNTYELDDMVMDFPDAETLRSLTTPKEEIYLNKLKGFLNSLGADMVKITQSRGEQVYSATLAENFLGLNKEEQQRMLSEVKTFIEGKGIKIDITDNTSTTPEGKEVKTKTVTVDWRKNETATFN
jgi:hypothetical protein